MRLLDLELGTLWITDERGRLERSRTREIRQVPLLTVAGAAGGLVWCCSATLPDEVVARIREVLATERASPGPLAGGWVPASAGALLEVLRSAGPLGRIERGPSYIATEVPSVPAAVQCWVGADDDRAPLSGLMPEADRQSLLEP